MRLLIEKATLEVFAYDYASGMNVPVGTVVRELMVLERDNGQRSLLVPFIPEFPYRVWSK